MTVLAAELPGIADAKKVEMTEEERIAIIERVLDELRPRIKMDGGGIELVGVQGRNIYVKMSGACIGCQLAGVTLGGIQMRLVQALKQVVQVLPAEKMPKT